LFFTNTHQAFNTAQSLLTKVLQDEHFDNLGFYRCVTALFVHALKRLHTQFDGCLRDERIGSSHHANDYSQIRR
jgi:hypothetical protein